MASWAFIITQDSARAAGGAFISSPRWTHTPDGRTRQGLPGASKGWGGTVPSFSLPTASDAALPGPLPAGGEGGVSGRSSSPPTSKMGPALPARGRGPPLPALGGFTAWGGMISRHQPMDRREVVSLGQLRMFMWALINGYGHRAGGRKGTVTDRGPGRLGGKRKMVTEAERWREGGK